MNQRLWHTLSKSVILSFFGILLMAGEVWGQATFVSARHETLSQREVDVNFNSGVSFSGAPTSAGWTVTVNGVGAPITSIGTFGPNTVRIQFNANGIAGHSAAETFLKPGEVLRVSYAGGGNLNAPGITPFANQQSQNNFVFNCAEMIFFKQEAYASVDVCSPVVMNFTQFVYRASLRYRNSSTFNLASVFYQLAWGDASVQNVNPYFSDISGTASPSFIDATGFTGSTPAVILTSRPTHNYPAPNPTDCSFNFSLLPFVASVASCPSITATTLFATYDTDNANSGTLSMPPSVAGSNLVCLGENVNMQFTDATTLNCRAAIEPLVPNEQTRHIRIVYGNRDFDSPSIAGAVNNIPDVRVGGVPVTNNNANGTRILPAGYFPTGAGGIGVPDFNGVIQLATPVTASTATTFMQTITTTDPSLQQVSQRFYVQLQYWDICNPYNAGDPNNPAPVTIENFVEIITKPAALTTAGASVCYLNPSSTAGINFVATGGVAGRTAVNWYRNLASVGTATKMTNPNGTNSLTFPASAYGAQGGIGGAFTTNNTNGRYYSVWATQVVGGTNACESDPIEIVIFQQPRIDVAPDIPNTPTGAIQVCNGPPGTAEIYSTNAPNTKTIAAGSATNGASINLPTENLWSTNNFGATVSLTPATGNSTTVTYNISPQPNPLDNGNVRVRRQYVTSNTVPVVSPLPAPFTLPTYNIAPQACQNANVNLPVDVYGQTSGGTVSNNQTICNGSAISNLTLSGQRGVVVRWERTFNAGAPFPLPGTAGLTTYSETPPNGPGTYTYYAVVQNTFIVPGGPGGPCPTQNSSSVTVTVNPVPPKPTISSGATTVCFGSTVTLTSSNVGGLAASYLWYRDGVSTGVTTQNINLTAVAQSGDYTVEVIGIAPTNCTSPLSDPITVTINPLPTATATGGGSACLGTPAADITWTLTGTANFNFTITASTAEPGFPIVMTNYASTTFTIVAPNPAATTTYTMTALSDGNSCNGVSLGGGVTVTVQATPPPSVETFTGQGPVCDDGGATNPPDAILDLLPNSVQNYAITYRLRRISTATFLPGSISFTGASDASGVVNIAPTYADFGAVPADPLGYQVVITAIQNTTTLCAGAVPINGPTLIINPRPPTPTNPVNGVACSTDPTGATISVDDPGLGNLIQWFTNAIGTIPAVGVTGGTRQEQFTPTSNATQTFFAFTQSQTAPTLCSSTAGIAVQHTQDLNPTAAANFPDFSTCNTSVNLTATPADNGGTGIWTIGNALYYETFPTSDNGIGITGPAGVGTFNHPGGNWSIQIVGPSTFADASDYIRVVGGRLEAQDVNDEVIWRSSVIPITAIPNINISLDLIEFGGMEADDHIRAFYRIDGGAEILIGSIDDDNTIEGDGNPRTVSVGGLTGNTLQIVVRIDNDAGGEQHRFDNVFVVGSGGSLPLIADVNDPTSLVTNIPVGTTSFTWTINSALGACSPTNDVVSVTRHALPVAVDPTPAVCEDAFGGGDASITVAFLTSLDNTVNGGNPAHTVQYFSAPSRLPGDLIGATFLASNLDQIYTRVTRTDVSPQCTQDGVVTFTVNPLPEAIPQDLTNPETVYCEEFPVGSGLADNIDLTILEDDIINGAAPRAVAWFESDMTTPVATPNDVDGVIDGRMFFARVTNTLTNCINFAQVEITVNPLPLDNPIEAPDGSNPATYTVCAGTSIILFQVDPSLNPGSTYNWSVPTAPGQFVLFGGGNPGDFFVLLQFPNPVAGPGLPITVQETSAAGCVGNVNTMNIIVDNAPPAPVIVGDNNVCANEQNVIYSISAPVGGSTYTWTVPGTLGSIVSGQGTSSIVVNMSNTSGNITVSETNANGCLSPAAAPFNVTVNARPVMTSLTTAELCSGQTVSGTHTLTASLVGTVFDWVVVGKVGPVGGASVGNTGSGQIGQTLTNTSSSVGQVIYDVTPKIDIDPGVPVEFCNGPTQTLTIDVYPEPVGQNASVNVCSDVALLYDIQTANVNTLGNSLPSLFTYSVVSSDPGNVPAEADRVVASNAPISHTYTNTTTANVTVTYTISPRFDAPQACPGANFTLTVTVRPEPVGGNDTALICSGDNVNYDLLANITAGNGLTAGTTFSWVAASNPNVSGESLTPQTSSTINNTLTNFTLNNEDVVYTVTPISSLGCNGDNFTVTVTVQPAPVGSNSAATICSDVALGINLTTSGAAVAAATYDITNIANGGLSASAGAPATGSGFPATVLADDAWTNTGLTPVNVVYTIVPVSAAGCSGASFTVTVTVDPEPVGNNSSVTRCSDNAVNVTLTTNFTSVPASTYNISVNANGLFQSAGTDSNGNGKAAIELVDDVWRNTGLASVNVIYTITPVSAAGCQGNPFTVTATIDPEPVGVTATGLFCSDQAIGLNINTNPASVAASTFNINVNANGLLQTAGTSSAGTGKLATEIAGDAWRNIGLVPVDVIYTITPVSGVGCLGDDFTITATINPEPVGSNSASTICSDVATGITFTTSGTAVAAATYNITNIVNGGLVASAGAPATGNGLAANVIADDAWTNTGTTPVNVVYTVVPVSAAPESCQGDPFTITLTINPEPVGANSSLTRCSDVAVGVTLTTSGAAVAASSYNILVANGGLSLSSGTASAGTGKAANEIADDVWRNTGLLPVDVVYTITPVSAAGCEGNPFTVTATINPEPVGANSALTRCSDVAVGVNLTTSGTAVAADNYTIAVTPNGLTQSGGTVSAGAGRAATEIADDIWRNTGLNPVDVVYTITPVSFDGCSGDPFTVTVTVNPEPVGSNSTISRCSDVAVGVNITTSAFAVAASSFDIAVNPNGLSQVGGTPSAGLGRVANEIADDIWRNTGAATVNVVYTITPNSAVSCSGDPFTITVAVDPEPVLAAGLNGTVCSDNIINLVLNTDGASVPAASYNITNKTVAGALTPVVQAAVPANGVAANYLRNDVYRNTTNGALTVQYEVVPVGTINGCLGDLQTITMTIDPEPVIDATLDALVCSDNPVNLVLATDGTSVAALNYNIVSRSVAVGLVPVNQVPVLATGVAANYLQGEIYRNTTAATLAVQYVVEAIGTINNCLGDQRTITISVAPEPVISPSLDASVCSDATIGLILNTNGTSVGAADYNIISRNIAGTLTPVNQVAVPANNVAANYLQNEVYRNTTAGSLTVEYVVEARGTISNCMGDQQTITITIDPEPVVATTLNASVCSDNAIGLLLDTAPGSVGASSYNIITRTIAVGLTPVSHVLAPVNGVAANYFQNDIYRNTTNGSLTVQYVVVARGTINNCLGDPRTITITIDPEPVIATNLNASVCSDAVVGLVLNTNGVSVGATSYNIFSRTVDPSLTVVAESPLANGVAANYLQNDVYRNTTNASLPVQYVVEALGTINGCLGDQRTITITVDPEPVISPTLDATVCSDSPVGLVLNTNGTSVSASNYNIVNRIVDPALTVVAQVPVSANAVAANYLQNEVYRNTTNASHTVQYIVEARGNINGCLGNQETITITIDPEPVVSGGLNATVCSDNVVGLVLNTNGTSIGAANYNIVSRIVAGALAPVTQVTIPATAVADNYLQNEVYSNTTNGPLTVQYIVEARGTINNCLGDQRTITITINPEPVISPILNATVCSNEIVNLLLNTNGTSVSAASYEVMNRNVAVGLTPITQVTVPQAGVGTNYLQNEVYENTTNASLSVQYEVRAVGTTGACVGDSRIITITIDPEPIISPALDASVCSDNTVNLVLNTNGSSIAAVNYNVVSRSVDPSLIAVNQVSMPGNNVLPTYLQNEIYRNTTSSSLPVQYVVEATGAINSCVGPQRTITIMIDPEPVVSNVLNASICSDDIVNLVFNTNGTSVAAANYNVLNRIVAGGLTPVVQVAVPQNGVADNYLQNEVYTNTTNTSLTVQYVVQGVGAINGCLGDQRTITITIAPEPVVATNLNKSVCSDLAVNLTLNTNGTSIGALNYDIVSRAADPSLNPINQVTVPQTGVAANYLAGEIYQNNGNAPLDVVYVVEAIGTIAGCRSDQRTITVTIQPEPVMDPGLDIPGVCSDLVTGLVLNTNGTSVAAANYNIQNITVTPGLTANGGNTPVPANGVAANYLANHRFKNVGAIPLDVVYRVIPVSAAGCLGDFIDITVTIDPEPVVDPGLNATVCSDNVSGIVLNTNGVSVAAATYDIALISQDAGLVGAPTTGNGLAATAIQNDIFTNTTFGPLNVVYEVTPFSGIGCQGQPLQITLTVRPEPVLNPALDVTRCSDFDFNVSLATNGTSVPAGSFNITNIVVDPSLNSRPGNVDPFGVPYNNVGANFLAGDSFENPTNGNLSVQYTVVPVSPQGCLGDPVVVTFTVQPEPVLDPALNPVPVCSDVISGITLGVDPGPPVSVAAATYNINNIIRQPGLIAGGTNASIGAGQAANAIFNDTFTNTSAGPLTVTYKIVPVSAAGCLGDEADVVLTINPSPAIAAGLDKTVCSTEASGIIFATSGTSAPALNYEITNVVIGGGAGDLIQTAGNTGPRAGVAANEVQNDQFQNTTNNPLTVVYTVRGRTAAGCDGPTRDIVLTIEPTILAIPVNNATDICSATATDIDLTSPTTPTSGNITFNYTAVSSIGGQITGFLPALNNLPLGYKIQDNLVNNSNNAATVTYMVTPVANGAKSGAGCLGTPVPVVVTVEPKPKLVASPLLQTVCESDGVNVSPTNILLTTTTVPSAGTMEFQVISAVPTGGMTLQPASSPLKTVYLNGETIADQWNNPTLTDQTVTYTLQPVVNGGLGCPGDNVIVTITVKPRPIISPVAPQTVCSGEFRSISLTTDIAGTFATWTVSAPPTITGALNGGGNSLDITLFNSGFNTETVIYTVTPKFNNCDGIPITINVTVNPTPNIVGLPPSITVCDGQTLNIPLTSNVAGTTFDWTVTDVFNLQAPGFFDGSGTTINQVINNNTGFQAILIYEVTPTSAGCVGLPRIMNVTVGSIVASVTPSITEICSGQRVQMTNSTLGATSHRWFYRVQGTTTELDVRTTPFVNYQLDNTSTSNPLIYEIVYQAKNGLCTVPDVVTPISVYRNVVAGFNEGTVPPIIGGTSTVNFSNTSNPVDGTQFRYEWNFGSNDFANPPTFTGATPPPVVYSQQGPYQITLKVTNIAGEVAGLNCESMFTKTIVVPVLPLVADFTLDPPAGCFPTIVRVVENKSTGDIMEWRVVDSNGGAVAVSGEDLPEFFIAKPGLFNVQLTTKDSFTDQVEFANADFEIYDLPIASFQARPSTVFIPDTELTTFNFSTKANFYQWDFGDGETSDEREPKHTYKIEGVYDVVLIAGFDHSNGVVCTDTLTQQVIAKQGGQTKIPNAFTPNPGGPSGGVGGGGGTGGAGSFNDVFLPLVKGVEEFNMQIFDRWGNLIFESNNSNVGWDGYDRNGNIMPAGVYVYKLTLRLSDGQRTTQIGDITMIR